MGIAAGGASESSSALEAVVRRELADPEKGMPKGCRVEHLIWGQLQRTTLNCQMELKGSPSCLWAVPPDNPVNVIRMRRWRVRGRGWRGSIISRPCVDRSPRHTTQLTVRRFNACANATVGVTAPEGLGRGLVSLVLGCRSRGVCLPQRACT